MVADSPQAITFDWPHMPTLDDDNIKLYSRREVAAAAVTTKYPSSDLIDFGVGNFLILVSENNPVSARLIF